ncbi:Protein N-terminal and lysine N-methyltransferase efm7 [Vanrija pseudolonga]|uniref:Protein N-terminal and lysine N-methyltransferase efm7 n=1 Tax=Vanrija pseudolonga TaxID=143232 RepID=A0AAF1BIP2_9TREE|nr:Protein N-terminal and lysine N-methyltransferase efm7 [Vanrija pseudolonga]
MAAATLEQAPAPTTITKLPHVVVVDVQPASAVTSTAPSVASVDVDSDAEDVSDIFDTGIFALFAIPPIGFSTASPDDPYTYTPPVGAVNRSPVKVWLPQPPAALHTALQANNLWLAGVFLADRICTGELALTGRTVVELGSGAGLPSIVAARDSGATKVVCSDYDAPEVISAIGRNFEASGADAGKWAVLGHSWGTDPSKLLAHAPGGFDELILADTLWQTDYHPILLDSVLALLAPNGVVHVAAGLHTGRGPHERFLALAETRGLRAQLETEVQWLPDGEWGPHAPNTDGLEEERGVVMYYTLHRQ